MKRVLQTLAVLAVLGGLGAAVVVSFGLYNVSARVGHLPGVSWVLHTTFRNAVSLRAPKHADVPPLSPEMAELGARHFDAACAVCHAPPGRIRTATMRAMLPEPPRIADAVAGWTPAELAWIVREGVKMSGMPHWPSVRDDEVWPVVAFLMRVGEMTGEDYAALTAPPRMPARAPEGAAYCAGCHGVDGRSGNPHIPRLDILGAPYLALSLETYRGGMRESGVMRHAASEVPETALPDLVRYFAEQGSTDATTGGAGMPGTEGAADGAPRASVPEGRTSTGAVPDGTASPTPGPEAPGTNAPGTDTPGADPGLVARGEALALASSGDRDVPACRACHGPSADRKSADFPELSGQYAPYLETQLKIWRDGTRGGGPRANLMTRAAAELGDDDIAALAAYYASLSPQSAPAEE
ncbi:c-type cytochrome [Mesobaculum littorinae]|uniref:C-type cytochrome n=1 Tax=Mesobaculum littorinae TaxID=2486419 RepID=A0A438ADL8_9RHOB|nr:c-type cytochrome [Mesobaculum littorinae]RVV96784.1 c-type cytochrome [Mesobaculum littorinae]